MNVSERVDHFRCMNMDENIIAVMGISITSMSMR